MQTAHAWAFDKLMTTITLYDVGQLIIVCTIVLCRYAKRNIYAFELVNLKSFFSLERRLEPRNNIPIINRVQ